MGLNIGRDSSGAVLMHRDVVKNDKAIISLNWSRNFSWGIFLSFVSPEANIQITIVNVIRTQNTISAMQLQLYHVSFHVLNHFFHFITFDQHWIHLIFSHFEDVPLKYPPPSPNFIVLLLRNPTTPLMWTGFMNVQLGIFSKFTDSSVRRIECDQVRGSLPFADTIGKITASLEWK